jgi:hypothetical protein
MYGKAKPYVTVEALVGVREGVHKPGRAREQAEGQVHRGAANGDGGGQRAL